MKKDSRFTLKTIESSGSGLTSVVVDKSTGVQYLLAVLPSMGAGMSVLVDKDCKPLIEQTEDKL